MKGLLATICCLVLVLGMEAQTTKDLESYYTFNDSSIVNEILNSGGISQPIGVLQYVCGVDGLASYFTGALALNYLSPETGFLFDDDDFTLSFFMNPTGTSGTHTVFSKEEACDDEVAFSIRYTPLPNKTITVELSETPTKRVVLSGSLDFNKCWQHIAVVRSGASVRLYINGVVQEFIGTTLSRIDLTNSSSLEVGRGPCVNTTEVAYEGALDEIRVYDRALTPREVTGLYEPLIPDNIITADTTVFLGNEVQIQVGNTCAESVSWSPSTDLSDPAVAEPLITPAETTVYYVDFTNDFLDCTSTDSIRITVIDPADLDCSQLFMPNAFTPNADGRNDMYGISNPYAISDLVSFEIFDRWGGRVFMTTDSMEKWDGNFKGQPVNPGIMLYKVIFECEGEEFVEVGSLSIIR